VHIPSPDASLAALDDAVPAGRIMAAGAAPDRDAESELCRRFGPRVRLYGLRHLGDAAAAADLVQEVLMLTLERLRTSSIHEPERLASFVLGTSRQMVIDQRRGELRRRRLLETFAGDLPIYAPAAGAPLDATRLRTCLERLSERERTVMLMSFYDERPAGGVATELGLTEANVRVIRHRSLRRLRACMDGDPSQVAPA
jgi:RNA polymerase sigma-70 factor, ECF subfamily